LEATVAVMVAGEHDHRRARGGQIEQRAVDDLLRLRLRRGGVEQVAGHEHRVDSVLGGDRRDLGEHGDVFAGTRPSTNRPTHVPVGGVEEFHEGSPCHGSSGWLVADGDAPRSASRARVAHAGKGNSRTSGIGSSGCDTIIVPGLMIVARCLWTVGKKPYSPRLASAASSRPTTRIDELAI